MLRSASNRSFRHINGTGHQGAPKRWPVRRRAAHSSLRAPRCSGGPAGDRPASASSTKPPNREGSTAAVIGAGIAGLTVAEVLSRHGFDRVVLLERDADVSTQAKLADRAGVPQYLQAHNLLLSGLLSLEELFPGFRRELVAEGATEVDW